MDLNREPFKNIYLVSSRNRVSSILNVEYYYTLKLCMYKNNGNSLDQGRVPIECLKSANL